MVDCSWINNTTLKQMMHTVLQHRIVLESWIPPLWNKWCTHCSPIQDCSWKLNTTTLKQMMHTHTHTLFSSPDNISQAFQDDRFSIHPFWAASSGSASIHSEQHPVVQHPSILSSIQFPMRIYNQQVSSATTAGTTVRVRESSANSNQNVFPLFSPPPPPPMWKLAKPG